MRLHFLGAEYSCQWPRVEAHESEIMGKYRGAAWSTKHPSTTLAPTKPVTLHFMGRSYEAHV
jgi:hypothetical protein